MRIASLGHAVFAATMIGLGVLGLVNSNFAVVWEPVPKGVPAHVVVGCLCALLSIVCGLGLLWKRTAAVAASVLLAYLLVWALFMNVHDIARAHAALGSWYGLAEAAVMVAAAWVLYAWFAGGDKSVRGAQVLFGLALIYFGLGHVVFLKETASDVPGWLPWHVGWAYFTGFAFIAAGLAVIVGVCARLAAALATVQIGLFVLLVWVPIVAASGPKSAFQWSETVISAALMVGAWVVADSYRGRAWLAVNRR